MVFGSEEEELTEDLLEEGRGSFRSEGCCVEARRGFLSWVKEKVWVVDD